MHTYADCMYLGYINILTMASGLQRTFVSIFYPQVFSINSQDMICEPSKFEEPASKKVESL